MSGELITLTGIAHGGEAVGRAGDLVAFVGLGLPGERVAVDIVERKPRFVRGRVREVIEASPQRVTPPCPIFGTCGGCHWQHASYAAQLEYKSRVLRDQLERGARLVDPPVVEATPSPQEWHYRNTVQMLPAAAVGADRLLCFQAAHSHDPVPVEHCYISDDLINRAIRDAAWAAIDDATGRRLTTVQLRVVPGDALQITLVGDRSATRRSLREFVDTTRRAVPELRGVLVAAERGATPAVAWGDAALTYRIGGYKLMVPADAFVQANTPVTERIVERVVEWLAPTPGDIVVDAYAGTGTFTLPLAAVAGSVIAVEAHRGAASAAAQNAARAHLMNVAVETESVERALARLKGHVDLVVLDPPRRGCADVVVDSLLRLAPRKIAYVSCEPSTLARDLRRFRAGGYALVSSGVMDMFPQTYHLESVSLLERR